MSEHRPVDLLSGPSSTQEVLQPIHVGTVASSMVLHDSSRCKDAMEEVSGYWNGEQETHAEPGLAGDVTSDSEPGIASITGTLQFLHALSW